MRKNSLAGLALVGLLCPALAGQANAHVLESDGTIGAVLHIDPDDDPIAGEETGIYFDFKDKTNRYKNEDCICQLVIEQDGQVIYEKPFTRPGGGTFTFPSRGVYAVKAVGVPKNAGAFDTFKISYDVRVERATAQENLIEKQPDNHKDVAYLVVGVLIVLFALAAVRYKIVKNAKAR